MQSEIAPHGGKLVNAFVTGDDAKALAEHAGNLTKIHLADRRLSDLEMIGNGAFSPLTGFMNRADYDNVVVNKRLANGLPWTIPITLAITADEAEKLSIGEEVALVDKYENILAVLDLEEILQITTANAKRVLVYRTTDEAHPGVKNLYRRGDVHLGGRIRVLQDRTDKNFPEYRLTPQQTRNAFAQRGWKKIVGFQTRNPIHRAHEYVTKCALETMDGLLIHPLVGATKDDDIPAEVRMECYRVLIDNLLFARTASCWRFCPPRCATPGRARRFCTRSSARITAARISSSGAIMPASAIITAPTTRNISSTNMRRKNSASRR